MKEYTVIRDGESDIKFTGEKLASVASSPKKDTRDFSGSVGHWEELTLYKTKGGYFVCAREEHSQWQNEGPKYYGEVCETEAKVIDFFGYSKYAKSLYEDANINAAITIE